MARTKDTDAPVSAEAATEWGEPHADHHSRLRNQREAAINIALEGRDQFNQNEME